MLSYLLSFAKLEILPSHHLSFWWVTGVIMLSHHFILLLVIPADIWWIFIWTFFVTFTLFIFVNCCLHFCCVILYKFSKSSLILFAELIFMFSWHRFAEQLFLFFLGIIRLLHVYTNENCLLTSSITIIKTVLMLNSAKPWEWFLVCLFLLHTP